MLYKRLSFSIGLMVLFTLGLAVWPQTGRAQSRGPIYTVIVSSTLTMPTIEYLRRALKAAEAANATALIIEVAAAGGVLRDVRPFAGAIAESNVPVVVYVRAGIQAGPVGALLLSAAQISVLGPGSSFGSPLPLGQVDAALSQQTRDLVLDSVTDQLRSWNAAHGRNTTWIDTAVRDGAVISNEQAMALTPPAVDLIAADASQLPALLEGRSVTLASAQPVTLTTFGRNLEPIEPSLWESLRAALAEPTVAFTLLILGTLLVYLEFTAPGTAIFAGAGAVLIGAALLGLLSLPIQGWAMLLLLFALALLGGEFAMPVHGALAIVGLALLVIAGLNLIDPAQAPGTEVALWAILAIAAAIGAVVVLGVTMAIRVRQRPMVTGKEGMIGMIAEVRNPLDPEGMVYVDGALWRAISEDGDAATGDRVRVVAIHNLQLVVRKL